MADFSSSLQKATEQLRPLLRQVWQWSIMPYLNEYYFDQRSRAKLWAWDGELLRGIRGEHGG